MDSKPTIRETFFIIEEEWWKLIVKCFFSKYTNRYRKVWTISWYRKVWTISFMETEKNHFFTVLDRMKWMNVWMKKSFMTWRTRTLHCYFLFTISKVDNFICPLCSPGFVPRQDRTRLLAGIGHLEPNQLPLFHFQHLEICEIWRFMSLKWKWSVWNWFWFL